MESWSIVAVAYSKLWCYTFKKRPTLYLVNLFVCMNRNFIHEYIRSRTLERAFLLSPWIGGNSTDSGERNYTTHSHHLLHIVRMSIPRAREPKGAHSYNRIGRRNFLKINFFGRVPWTVLEFHWMFLKRAMNIKHERFIVLFLRKQHGGITIQYMARELVMNMIARCRHSNTWANQTRSLFTCPVTRQRDARFLRMSGYSPATVHRE